MREYSNGGACEYTTGMHGLSQGEERHGENGEEERVDAREGTEVHFEPTMQPPSGYASRQGAQQKQAAAKRAAKPRSLS